MTILSPKTYVSQPYATIESSLPPSQVSDIDISIDRNGVTRLRTIVVLDDDPTGTQTVRDITVLTTSEKSVIKSQLRKREPGFFILTNSRAFPPTRARELLKRILTNVRDAALEEGIQIEVVTRSDSCLRGHFPLEPDLVHEIMGPVHACILAPAFLEGGRVTVNDLHYVREKDTLVPVANTQFAEDKAFGFQSSNLQEWIVEKFERSGKDVPKMASISLGELRQRNAVPELAARLRHIVFSASLTDPPIIILNAFSHDDMKVFVAARARLQDFSFVYRSGASLVSTYMGIPPAPPLTPSELLKQCGTLEKGGLVIVGSYVPKTTAQFKYLLDKNKGMIRGIELQVADILSASDKAKNELVHNAANCASIAIKEGMDVVVSTSRKLVSNNDPIQSLPIGEVVSNTLCEVTKLIDVSPRYVIAKGGITSSDIATAALGITRATVIGQAAPGIPVWKSDDGFSSCKWPGVPYIVFPGNTGDEGTLGDMVFSFRSENH